MKKINLAVMPLVVMAMIFCLGFISCESDNNEVEAPSALFKTWYLGDDTSLTFNPDGTGLWTTDDSDDYSLSASLSVLSRIHRSSLSDLRNRYSRASRALVSYPFTYTYDASNGNLVINLGQMVMSFSVLSLTEDSLVLVDEEGDKVNFKSSKGEDGGNLPPVGDKKLLVGKWGFAGVVWTEYTSDSLYLYDQLGENGEKYKYSYVNHIVNIWENNEWWPSWEIVSLTKDVCIERSLAAPYDYFPHFRILDELDTVGDASLLYGKTWSTFGEGDDMIRLTFSADGKMTYEEDGFADEFNYTYDNATHKMTWSDGYQTEVMDVIKLTENVIILVMKDGQGAVDEVIECRVL